MTVQSKKFAQGSLAETASFWQNLDAGLDASTPVSAGFVPALPVPLATSPDSWISAVSGNWTTATDWSTGVAPTSSNDVTVSVAGTYTVTIAATAAANSVTLNNAAAKISDTSSLSIGTNLAITSGQFILNSTGVLVGGTVSVGSSGTFSVYSGATMSGVTYQGTLAPSANSLLYIENGITLTGAGGTGNGTIALSSGDALNILDNETLNNATLIFVGGNQQALYLNEGSSTGTQSLTLGSGFTISQTAGVNLIGRYIHNGGSIADSGLISVSGGTLVVGNGLGMFSDSGSISVTGGVFDLTTEMVASGSIATSGTGAFLLDSSGVLTGTVSVTGNPLHANAGTLDALTWNGPLTLAAGQFANIEGGLSVANAGTLNLSAGSDTIYVLDSETLNNETLSFGSGSGGKFGLYDASNVSTQTLTLGSGFVVSQGGGTNYLGGYQYAANGLLVNAGTIAVSGGTLVDNSTLGVLDNTGKISVSGGTFTASNSISFVNAGSIAISGGIFNLATAMTSTGSIATSGSGVFEISTGGVLSGTISPTAQNFSFQSGTLSAATSQGPLTFGANQRLFVQNGLSVTGTGGTGSGTISLAAGNDTLIVLDTETLNTATLAFGGNNGSAFYVYGSSATQTVTLGSGFTITQTGGSNSLQGHAGSYYGNLVNAGLISISGGTMGLYNLTTFANTGSISVTGGTFTTSSAGTFTNSGSITVAGGIFATGSAGTFTNSGSITVSSGVFDLQSTLANLGNITTSGSGVFELGIGGVLSGTINPTAQNFSFQSGTLSAANWQGPLSFGANQRLFVQNGLSVTGTGGIGNGTISLAAGNDTLLVLDTETLNNATLNFGGNNGSAFYVYGSSATQTVTLGSGFTITQTGGSNSLQSHAGSYYGSLLNAGLISVSGGTMTLYNLATFANTGTISITGGTFATGSALTFTNSGSITVSSGVFDLQTALANLGNITTSGSGVFELGAGGVLSGTIAAAAENFSFQSGTLSAATWQGPLTFGANQRLYVQNGLSVTGTGGTGNGTISLAAGNDTLLLLDTETLNNATLTFGGSNGSALYIGGTSTTQTVTLGSGFTLAQSGGSNSIHGNAASYYAVLVNAGLINVSGGTLGAYNMVTFANTGTIAVTGGIFDTGSVGTFTNTGSITVSSGVFDLQSVLAGIGNVTTSGSGVFEIGSGGILSGTISATGQSFSFQSGTLSAATWQGPLTFGANQTLFVQNGLTVTGAGGTGNGTISLTGGGDNLLVLDTETLNNATLIFGSGTSNALYVNGLSRTTTVTLGSGFTVTQSGGSNSINVNNAYYYGNLFNAGQINVSGGTLELANLTSFSNSGSIVVSGGVVGTSGVSTFTNSGTLAVTNGGTLALSGVTTFANSVGATLSGTYTIGAASLLELTYNTVISTLTGNVTLTGAGSLLESYNTVNGSWITLDAQLTTVAAGGTLTLGTGRSFSGARALVDNGSIFLGGGTLTETGFSIGSTGTLSGFGKITPAIADGGTIIASGGVLTIAGALSGSGFVTITTGATFEAGSATSSLETFSFAGTGAALKLDAPASFASVIAGFAAGDVIDFAKTTLTSVSTNGTTLLAVSSTGTTMLTLAAPIANEHFSLTSDGAGGTNVTAYALAQSSAHAPEPVAFGNHHVGDSVSSALTLSNTAPANGFSEALDAAIGAATGAATAAGSFTGLAAGQSNTSSLAIGLNTATTGTLSGTAIITENSDGTGIDGFGTTSLGTQLVNVAGAVYAYAQGVVAGGNTVTLANTHVGQSASATLTLSNAAAANGFSEALDASLGSASAGFSASGSATLLAAGAQSAVLSVGYQGGANGAYSGTATLSLVSDGTGIDGLGTTTLAPQTLNITGAAYAYAAPQVQNTSINLGVVHVGQADSAALTLTNTAAANGYAEALDAGWATATGATSSGSLTGLAAGKTDMSSLAIGLATSASGSFAGSAVLGLVSDGTGIDGLGTTTLAGQTITVAGIVDNYAVAAFQDPGGPAIAGSGTSYAITLGSVAQGSAAEILTLGALNAATGLADLLQGTLSSAGGTGFTNSGFGSFSGLAAGKGETSQSVTLSTSNAGTFTETILLSSAGTNASGYNGALPTETLTVTGVITPVGSTTYTLAAGANHIVGAAGGDVFVAPIYSLNSRDSLTGGAGTNVMQFLGGGQFDIGAPTVFSNIPTLTAYEGQTASGAVANTQQVVFLRDGSNETLNVVAGVAAKGNTNPESIFVYSSNATNTINLASGYDTAILATGTDTVALGGTRNSVVAGGGTALVQASAANAAASVVGTTTGSTTLEITTGGTVTLNAADTYLTVKLDAATLLYTGKLGFITVNGGNGGDTIKAGGTNQTLIGGTGDSLFSAASGSTTFAGASTALTGDSLYSWTTGDVIDLTNVNPSTVLPLTYNGGKLTVSDGTNSATITVSGTGLALHSFVVAGSDGNGGTLIDYHT